MKTEFNSAPVTGSRAKPCVYLIEDDSQIIASLRWMLSGVDVTLRSFIRPSELLDTDAPSGVGCLVVDLRLPEMSGIDLVGRIRDQGWRQPFIVITGYGDVPDAVAAMHLGAVDFLQKPISQCKLIESIRKAIDADAARLAREEKQKLIVDRMDRLSPREKQVLDRIIDGRLNKQIAVDLSISAKTVEAHRANVMRKLDVGSVAQLVRFVIEAKT